MLTREARKMPRQPLADLRGDVHRLVQRQRPPLDPLLERLPLVVRHHEVELAVGGLVDLADGADVGVVECRRRLRLLQEPLLRRFVAGQVRREELDRHLALQARVVGRVDDPHATVAEFGAISMDILDFRARVLAIEGSKLRRMGQRL